MYANMHARGVNMGKTPQGMNADLQRSANVFPNTPANVKEWSKPGGSRRMDIEGIDTKPKSKGISINIKRDKGSIGQQPKETKKDMEIVNIDDDVEMKYETAVVIHGGSDEKQVLYSVTKNGQHVSRPLYSDDMSDNQLDAIEDVLRNAQKEIRPDYPIGVPTFDKSTIGDELTRRKMYYLTGDTKTNKELIKEDGFVWTPELQAWASLNPPTQKMNGVDVEIIPTYKTKNGWSNYEQWTKRG